MSWSLSPAAASASMTVNQPFRLKTATGFVGPDYTPLGITGNVAANGGAAFGSPAIPAVPWTPTYGLQRRWNEGPQIDVADPQCRMLSYPSHCSLDKALTYIPYPDVASGVSRYPYGNNASVQLTDGSPSRLGDPGFFLPVSDVGADAAVAASHPSTHVYGNVSSYAALMTDAKDGPASVSAQTCGTYYTYAVPVPSMAGYESSSVDPTVMTCPQSYIKTGTLPATVTLPPTRMAVALANYPDPITNASFSYAAFSPASAPLPAFAPASAFPTPPPRGLVTLMNQDVLEPLHFTVDNATTYTLNTMNVAHVPMPNSHIVVTRGSNGDSVAVSRTGANMSMSNTNTLQLRRDVSANGVEKYVASRQWATQTPSALAETFATASAPASASMSCAASCYMPTELISRGLTCSGGEAGAPAAANLQPCQAGSCRLNETNDGVCYDIKTLVNKGVTCRGDGFAPAAEPVPVCVNSACSDPCLSKFGVCELPQCPKLDGIADMTCDKYCSQYASEVNRTCCVSACECCNAK